MCVERKKIRKTNIEECRKFIEIELYSRHNCVTSSDCFVDSKCRNDMLIQKFRICTFLKLSDCRRTKSFCMRKQQISQMYKFLLTCSKKWSLNMHNLQLSQDFNRCRNVKKQSDFVCEFWKYLKCIDSFIDVFDKVIILHAHSAIISRL